MAVELKFYVSTNIDIKNMGTSIPAWAGNYQINNWWSDADPEVDYFYSVNNGNLYIQYGQNISYWAATRFFGESIQIDQETENPDGSVTVSLYVTPRFFVGRKTNFAATTGPRVQYTVRINNQIVYTFNGITVDEFTNGEMPAVFISTTIAAQQEFTGTALRIEVTYPDGEYNDSVTTVGYSILNPNQPGYKPMALRKNNAWQTLNIDPGFIAIRKSGSWQDRSKEVPPEGEENEGSNRIRKSGIWRKQGIQP
jgi:hypothetical protein